MKALGLPGASGSGTDLAARRAAASLSLMLLIAGLPAGAEDAAQDTAQESKAAVWKIKEVGFLYRSSQAIYSCGALRDRVASVLRAIGARDDVDVKVTGCDAIVIPMEESRGAWGAPPDWGTGSDRGIPSSSRLPSDRFSNRNTDRGQLADVRVRAMMPTEITPEVLAEIDRDKSRRELISRVTGDPAAKLNDPVAFPAAWQTVTLSHRTIGLVAEECELLEQMSSSIIPQLGARVVRRSFTCDRRSVSRMTPQITVEAFLGVQIGAGTITLQAPAEGEGKGDPGPGAPGASDAAPAEPATAEPSEPATATPPG